MTTSSGDADSTYPACPHCGDIHICQHVALAVDLTFREMLGGFLKKSLSKELRNYFILADNKSNVEEYKFDEITRELRSSGKFIEMNMSDDIAPGLSSSYTVFYSAMQANKS